MTDTRTIKTLKELTIKDNFMFGAVMMDEENCRRLLELTLGFPIARVVVSKEKSIVFNPEYKGVRLDIFAKDESNTHYNVEMQMAKKPALGKRARYYHSQLDMELLLVGDDYSELPDVYVIFICDFDPFGKERYCYTFENHCREEAGLHLPDGSHSVFLSTYGKNAEEVPQELVKFLEFVKADLSESGEDFEDDFISRLQKTIGEVKKSREMEERFMIFKEMLRDERAEGRVEGKVEDILDLLEDLGTVPEELRGKIMAEKDLAILKNWLRAAAKADSVEDFLANICL